LLWTDGKWRVPVGMRIWRKDGPSKSEVSGNFPTIRADTGSAEKIASRRNESENSRCTWRLLPIWHRTAVKMQAHQSLHGLLRPLGGSGGLAGRRRNLRAPGHRQAGEDLVVNSEHVRATLHRANQARKPDGLGSFCPDAFPATCRGSLEPLPNRGHTNRGAPRGQRAGAQSLQSGQARRKGRPGVRTETGLGTTSSPPSGRLP
jgi:hypothetical protein